MSDGARGQSFAVPVAGARRSSSAACTLPASAYNGEHVKSVAARAPPSSVVGSAKQSFRDWRRRRENSGSGPRQTLNCETGLNAPIAQNPINLANPAAWRRYPATHMTTKIDMQVA
jgi:hypothetical protein